MTWFRGAMVGWAFLAVGCGDGTDTLTDPGPPQPPIIAEVSAGGHHTCAIDRTGQAYCWGSNTERELGLPTVSQSLVPVKLPGTLLFSSIGSGSGLTCGLVGPRAYCWGNGDPTPTIVPSIEQFTSLTVGGGHVCALTNTGIAHCWGSGEVGQLGDGGASDSTTPLQVMGGHRFISLSAGATHTCGVAIDRGIYCWGDGRGRLGNGSNLGSLVPVAVQGAMVYNSVSAGAAHTCGITISGPSFCWGDVFALGTSGDIVGFFNMEPVLVDGPELALISSGWSFNCGLTLSGVTYCWGLSENQQAGNFRGWVKVPSPLFTEQRFVQISAGMAHACGVTEDGEVHCWGLGVTGQLGAGTTHDAGVRQVLF